MQGLHPVSNDQNTHKANNNIAKLLGMVRNRSTPSDNLEICRECLSQNNGDLNEALNTIDTVCSMVGSPSENLKGILRREAASHQPLSLNNEIPEKSLELTLTL